MKIFVYELVGTIATLIVCALLSLVPIIAGFEMRFSTIAGLDGAFVICCGAFGFIVLMDGGFESIENLVFSWLCKDLEEE